MNVDTEVATRSELSTPGVEFEERIDLIEIAIKLARRKNLIMGTTLVAAVITAIITLLVPNRYTAVTKILPPRQTQSVATALLSQLTGGSAGMLASVAGKDLGLKDPNDIYVGMLRSRTVQDALVAKLDLAHVYNHKRPSENIKELDDATEIRSGKDSLIAISVEDKDPKRAAVIANAYVTELANLTQTFAVTEASQRRLFFEQQLQQAKDALADAEVKLKETQQKTGLIDLDSQAKVVIEAIGTVRGQIAAAEVQMQAMRSFATPNHPDYILLQQQIAGLRAQLAKLEREEQGGNGDPVVAAARVPAVALDYVRRLREVKYRETLFELLARQYEVAKLDESKQGSVIQILDPAIAPDRKSSPKRSLIVTLVTMAAGVLTSLYVLVTDALQRAQEDPAHARRLAILSEYLLRRNLLKAPPENENESSPRSAF